VFCVCHLVSKLEVWFIIKTESGKKIFLFICNLNNNYMLFLRVLLSSNCKGLNAITISNHVTYRAGARECVRTPGSSGHCRRRRVCGGRTRAAARIGALTPPAGPGGPSRMWGSRTTTASRPPCRYGRRLNTEYMWVFKGTRAQTFGL